MKKRCRFAFLNLLVLVLGLVWFSGCASVYTQIAKGELRVESQVSNTVFLDPLSPEDREGRTVWLRIANTTGKKGFEGLEGKLVETLEEKGYRVTRDVEDAGLMMHVNLLSMKRTSLSSAELLRENGYRNYRGSVWALGSTLGRGGDEDNHWGAIIGGLVASLAVLIVDANTEDVTYAMVSNVQLSVRQEEDFVYEGKQDVKQGSSGSEVVEYRRRSPWLVYRTGVVTKANEVNLEWEEAVPMMRDSLTKTLGGLF